MILYSAVRALLKLISRVLWRTTIEGTENVPAGGSFILAPVHRSFIDFALVSAVTRRRMRYMGKDSLWRFKPLGWFISVLGAYPVRRRTADREALRRTIAVIEAGEPVVLFPEGTRRSGPVVEELFEGAAYVATRTGVPVVPVGIGGSEHAMPKGSKLPRRVKVHIVVGEPMAPPATPEGRHRPSRRAVHQFTLELQTEVQRLFDQAEAAANGR